jgi:DNA adenine methylase
MPKSVLLSPLRYPGSKRCLVHYMNDVLQLNNSSPVLFVEPFAGGSSVALQLLQWQVVERIGLIDSDPLVADFWKTVFFDAGWLIREIGSIAVTLEKWQWFRGMKPRNTRENALKCLFLNRTSFSGIMASSAGPIGGKQQNSEYKIDCRFRRKTLIKRVKQAEKLKHRVEFIWNTSWYHGLKCLRKQQQSKPYLNNVFFYFDPPFFEKADRLYTHYFREDDHLQLRNYVQQLRDPWVLSYDSVKRVTELYEDPELPMEAQRMHIDLIYTASGSSKRRTAREIIISNLTLPSPAQIKEQPEELPACGNSIHATSARPIGTDYVLSEVMT